MSIWATWAIYLRFSSRLEIESDRDKISLDCFPSLRTINMYPMLILKEERHHVSQTTNLGASPPLILRFHPSKRHAALIASCDQGSIVLAFTLVLLVLKHFLMESSASYPDFHSMIFSRFIVLLLFVIYEYHVISARSCFILILILVTQN